MSLPEEDFKVIWKLRATRVSRIHCDADVTRRNESQCCSFKLEILQLLLHGSNDAQNLVCKKIEKYDITTTWYVLGRKREGH